MDLTIIEQKPVPLTEVNAKLENAKKAGALNFRAEKVNVYITDLGLPENQQVIELQKKISDLNITRLRDRHIIKVLDLMPKDIDTLKSIFTGEAVSLKPEELKLILDTLNSN